ncbi:hypothetical protein EW142_04380 [Flagellimonas allohymeniacidonis]|uniref:Right-handed parallel beta-helix repeat-containing protein n=1 Tax=Flagellimonas allohymeniacidonis TaxID=2517819 RepID=A0A4Q8QH43_9FLAO|nr:hypothetical protein EW142_04380 [Allomuricauda hymeniacidonis]
MSAIFGLVLVLCWSSCRNDFEFESNSGNLRFSKDTVFLDTVFTNIGSATYTLKVYNRLNEDIAIPFVGLQNGQSSSYRLNVDGEAGKEFSNIPLLANDSLFVFVETTFDVAPTGELEFLNTDRILFGEGAGQQSVELVTLVKDAVFLYPATDADGLVETIPIGLDEEGNEIRIEGFYLDFDELNFTNEKPYVIYGYAAVPNGSVLTIDAGARVHFHNNSGIMVDAGALMQVNGTLSEDQELLENEVIFEGDRLEPSFADTPGQWGTIWIREGSIDNSIQNLTLKNATVGLRVEGNATSIVPSLTLQNSQIYNSLDTNLWATTATINAANSVFGGAGNISFHGNLGGNYNLVHCTLANYWNNGFRSGPALALDNFGQNASGEVVAEDLQQANFTNCIIDGSVQVELSLQQNPAAAFNFLFENCTLQFNDTAGVFEGNPLYNLENLSNYQNIILNGDMDFEMPFENNLQIGPDSEAIDQGKNDLLPPLPQDILGRDRISPSDIGAYEYMSSN